MLVLTRKSQESVVIGGSGGFEHLLKVTVIEIAGGKVKLGFDVDRDVPVHRSEVWEKIHGNGRNASGTAAAVLAGESSGNKPILKGTGHSRPLELPSAAVSGPRKFGILVVDDEEVIRNVLEVQMRKEGFAVWLAAEGHEALQLYRQHQSAIDVVLLDLRMPGLDGTQTLAGLLQIDPQVYCYFMTGDLGEHAEWSLCNLGAAAVIRKPFDLTKIADMLREMANNEPLKTSGL